MKQKLKQIEPGIFKRPDGRYNIKHGVRVRCKVEFLSRKGVTTLGEARRLKDEFIFQCAQKKERLANGVVTFEQAKHEYLAHAETRLRPSTWLNIKKNLDAHTSVFASRYVDTFTAAEITAFINKGFSQHSDDTKNNQAKFLRQVFQLQVDKGVLATNPAKGIRINSGGLKYKKLTCMTRNEISGLLSAAYRIDHPWKDIYFVVYQLGLRSGEAYELKFSDIDYENSFVNISRSFCFATKKVGPPKNKEPRVVPLSRDLMVRLKELQLAAGGDYILPKHSMWSHGEAAKVLRSFQRDLGIRETNFHSLRASFITHLLLKGEAVTKVQGMVGHADLKTTQKYVRLVASDLKGATEAISWNANENKKGDVIPFKPRG